MAAVDDAWLSVRQAARHAGVCEKTIRRAYLSRQVQSTHRRRAVRSSRAWIDEWPIVPSPAAVGRRLRHQSRNRFGRASHRRCGLGKRLALGHPTPQFAALVVTQPSCVVSLRRRPIRIPQVSPWNLTMMLR